MKSLTTNDQVKNLVQIRKSLARGKAGNLAENQAFIEFLTIWKELTTEFDTTWDVIHQRMDDYDISKIDLGERGYITMAERKSYSGNPAPRFYKKVLDSSKIAAYVKISGGSLPKGVNMSTSRFLQKRIKLEA